MKLVRHLLDAKGRNVISISPDASVFDAIKMMADESIGSLVVLDAREKLVGIVTERDYARKVIVKGRSSHDTRVAEIMSADVATASGDDTVNSCMEIMTAKKIRHLPVVENDQVVAMVSIGDLVQAIIADQQEEIEHLEQYISS
jgi:CBS domain-containing protein